jgi:hypothetical protein
LGILKSTDGGTTWSFISSTQNSNFYYVNKIAVNSSGHIYAATSTGVRRSTDGGNTWTQVLSGNYADIEIASNGTYYAATNNSAGPNGEGVYRSATGNSGDWTNLNSLSIGLPSTNLQRIEVAAAPSNANVIYVLQFEDTTAYTFNGSSYNDIVNFYKSTDGGASFTKIARPLDADSGIPPQDFTRSQGWYDLVLKVDPNNSQIVYTGGVDIFKSSTGGSSWVQVAHWYGGYSKQYAHADQHGIEFEGTNSSVLYFTNDGGLFRTTNGGSTIPTLTAINTNYNVTQFYACAMHPASGSNYFLAGAQDNGTQQFTTAGFGATSQASGGDGAFCNIDQLNPNTQFSQYVYNNYYRSTNGGASFFGVGNSFSNTGRFINPSRFDDNTKALYAATSAGKYLRWANANSSATFEQITVTALGTQTVSALTISPVTSDRLYLGTGNGQLVEVDNASTATGTIAGRTLGTPTSGYLNCIWQDPSNGDHIVVTYSNFGVNNIKETYNASAATPTWTTKDGDLADMPVYFILPDPSSPSTTVLIATEYGVWNTTNFNAATPNWTTGSNGMPNVRVTQLYLRTSDNTVVASTHGRGLFTATLCASNPAAPTGTGATRCGTGTVTLTATAGAGETIDWYPTATGGGPLLFTGTNFTTPVLSPTTTYYAGARNITTGCASLSRTAVTATFNTPAAATGTGASRCGTGTVTLTATVGAGETVDWYAAATGGVALLSGNTSFTTPSISVTTTYYAQTRRTSDGCLADVRTPVVATVNQIPATPGGTNVSRCGAGTVTLTATVGAGETVDWYDAASGGNLLLSGNTSYTTPSISTNTVYYAQARNTACGSVSASRKAITAVINPNPTVNISANPGTTICAGNSVTLTETGGNATSWSWLPGGATTSAITVNPVSNTVYQVTGSIGSCSVTSSVTVTVNAAAPAATGVSICKGESGSLTSSATCSGFINAGTTLSGTWNAASDPVALRPTTSISNSSTCSFDASITRNYVIQTFQVSVSGSYTFEMNNNTAYDGMGYIVSGSFVPGNCSGGGTWIKGDDDGGILGDEPLMTATLNAGTTYSLISTTYGSVSGTVSNTFGWTITPPSGGEIMLPSSGTIQWFTAAAGGSPIGSGSPFNPVGVAGSGLSNTNTEGTYTFYAACSNNSTCRTAVNFVINAAPSASITGSNVLCAGNSTILYSNASAGSGTISSYQWKQNGSVINGATNATYAANTAGSYTVTVTNSNGCSFTSTPFVITIGTTSSSTTNASVCSNHLPYTWNGNNYSASGSYDVTLTNAAGCDSIATLVLTVKNTSSSTTNVSLCSNQLPYVWNGNNYSASGSYNVTLTNAAGCDSIATLVLTVNSTPTVNAGTYSNLNLTDAPITLSGTPAGGTFSGPGVVGNSFDPAAAGAGTHTITYTYTNASGCTVTATTTITVIANCAFSVENISGPVNACAYMNTIGDTATYTISTTGASSITWSWPAAVSYVSGQGTNTLRVKYSPVFTTGTIGAVVTSACASSITRTLSVTKTIPALPGVISGPTNACVYIGTSTPVTYTTTPVADAITYRWTLPANTTLISATTDSLSITIRFDAAFASGTVAQRTIKVRSVSGCGTSADRTLAIGITAPAIPGAISGSTNVCANVGGVGGNVTYSIHPVANATSYNWLVPTTATIVSYSGGGNTANDTAIVVSFSNSFVAGSVDTVKVSAVSICGSSNYRTLVVRSTVPAVPGPISGTTDACPLMGTGQQTIYSINKVANATSYNWVLPAGMNLVSGQGDTAITVTFDNSFANSFITVRSVSGCGVSATVRSLTIYKRVPVTPAAIFGPTDACPIMNTANHATYTIRKVAYATSYTWVVPAGATIVAHPGGTGINDTIILVNYSSSFISGAVTVVANANCASSGTRSLTIMRKVPSTPGTITGTTDACPLMGTATYSIAPVLNATAYGWTVPSGASIVSGDGTTSITVSFDNSFSGGNISVVAVNNCMVSAARSLVVSKKLPATRD